MNPPYPTVSSEEKRAQHQRALERNAARTQNRAAGAVSTGVGRATQGQDPWQRHFEQAHLQFQLSQQLHQQNVASSADLLGQVTHDNGDGTYTVELSAGGGTKRHVPATPGVLIFVDAWYTIQRSGPGWQIGNPAPYKGGNS